MRPKETPVHPVSSNVRALVALAREHLGTMTQEDCARGESALRALVSKRATASRLAGRLATGAMASIALAVALVVALEVRSPPLDYSVENAVLTTDQAVLPQGGAAPVLHFSDGTEVRLAPAARARIHLVTDRGAALALDGGQLHAEVVHSSNSQWRFDAGPYVVDVTGTSFLLAWDPDQGRFELKLEHGSVTVHGLASNSPLPVRSGQWLTIFSRTNEVSIRDLTSEKAGLAEAPPEPKDAGARGGEQVATSEQSGSVSPTEPKAGREGSAGIAARDAQAPRQWVRDFGLGSFELIVADAQRRGLEACLANVSSEELSILADAARYTRRIDVARRALLAQRKRFSGSINAAEAAFFLARLDAAENDNLSALKYLTAYLTESRAGRYADEALGRKMAITHATYGTASARPLALQYLSRYPTGTYTPAARAIVSGP